MRSSSRRRPRRTAALAHAAIERGLPVLVEKPLAATVEEGLALVAARTSNTAIPLQVGHIERFNPAVLELGRRLEQGWAGNIYSIASRRAGPFPARIRDVGVAIDLATHDADIISWVAGERPTRVYAETAQRIHATNEDFLFGLLHFPSGVDRDARRQLAHAREAALADGRGRTRAVRAGLSHPAAGLHEVRCGAARRSSMATRPRSRVIVKSSKSRIASHWPRSSMRSSRWHDRGRPVVDGEDGLWALTIASGLLQAAT